MPDLDCRKLLGALIAGLASQTSLENVRAAVKWWDQNQSAWDSLRKLQEFSQQHPSFDIATTIPLDPIVPFKQITSDSKLLDAILESVTERGIKSDAATNAIQNAIVERTKRCQGANRVPQTPSVTQILAAVLDVLCRLQRADLTSFHNGDGEILTPRLREHLASTIKEVEDEMAKQRGN